jgi:XTP/dITP diphosphohydrolase
MKEIVFATQNPNKVAEVNRLLPEDFRVRSLGELGIVEDIPETRGTLEGNALQKAQYVWDRYAYSCFSEDTGLEVAALHGAPGVITARYAGPEKDPQANMEKLLRELEPHSDRSARFRTVMALLLDGEVHLFEGIASGSIALTPAGDGGFGYDPIFIPEGKSVTFAQMAPAEKNAISHRARALEKLLSFLKQL